MGRCHSVRFLLAGLLLIVLVIGATLAYFYDDDSVSSDVTIRRKEAIEVHLIEPLWESDEQGLDLLPGDIVPADPAIVNTADPVYMRIVMTLYDRTTKERITGERAAGILSMLWYAPGGTWINEAGFTYDTDRSNMEDGYFCYNYTANEGILETGGSAVLYDQVRVPVQWEQSDVDAIGGFLIHMEGEAIHADSVKADGMETAEQVFELLHRDSRITGGTADE